MRYDASSSCAALLHVRWSMPPSDLKSGERWLLTASHIFSSTGRTSWKTVSIPARGVVFWVAQGLGGGGVGDLGAVFQGPEGGVLGDGGLAGGGGGADEPAAAAGVELGDGLALEAVRGEGRARLELRDLGVDCP